MPSEEDAASAGVYLHRSGLRRERDLEPLLGPQLDSSGHTDSQECEVLRIVTVVDDEQLDPVPPETQGDAHSVGWVVICQGGSRKH